MRRYAIFSGRSTRAEFWWFTLASAVMSLGARLLDDGLHTGGVLNLLVLVVNALPSLSVFVRRMHDTDRTGWWLLAPLTVVGLIPVFVFLCRRGTPGPNRFGPPDHVAAPTMPAASRTEAGAASMRDARDPIHEVERLAELHSRGAITDAEFARMKGAVLAAPDPAGLRRAAEPASDTARQ